MGRIFEMQYAKMLQASSRLGEGLPCSQPLQAEQASATKSVNDTLAAQSQARIFYHKIKCLV